MNSEELDAFVRYGTFTQRARSIGALGKEHADDPDAPAVADEDGDSEHAEWKPLWDCEDYLNEMPEILNVFGLEKSPDHTSFCN